MIKNHLKSITDKGFKISVNLKFVERAFKGR